MRPNQTCKESGCLLEKLAELAGCNYLSDLRCALSFRYSLFVLRFRRSWQRTIP